MSLMVKVFVESYEKAPAEIVLDMDTTDLPLHGKQEGRFFHGYYDTYCYLPLYVFCGDHVLCSRLREANHDAAFGCLDEIKRIVAQMRTATRDFEFAGHQIRANELLFVATSVPHFMEEYFPQPEKFDIDRYQKPRAEHLQSGAYSPYGRGPHTCLGKTLAEVQMTLTLARLFHQLDLGLEPPGYVLQRKTLPTPGPSMKFKVRVKQRRH